MLEARRSQCLDRILRIRDPVGSIDIAVGLIPNVDDHVGFLPDQNAFDLFPIRDHLCKGDRIGTLAVSSGIVDFKHTNQLVRFA